MPLALLRHALLDNPITTKHIRSRLRRGQVLSPVTVVAVLSLLIAWWGYVAGHYHDAGVARLAAMLQGVVLVFMGAGQIGVSLSGARESGILDFHRISPLPPAVTTLGFFLGAPVREYVLALIPIPLLLISVGAGGISVGDFLQWQLALLLIAWAFHVVALLSALVSRRPVRNGGAGLIVLGVIVFGNLSGWLFYGLRGFAASEGPITLPFFGLSLHWLAWLALYSLPLIGFGMLAATRKMRSARAHLLSKPQAVAFLATSTILILGAARDPDSFRPLDALILYGLCGAGVLASLPIVPTLGEYTRGLRRAARHGHVHLPAWDDLALNRPALAALCAIVLLGGSVLFWGQDAAGTRPPHLSLAVAVAVLTVAYVGLAHQYFALVAATRSGALLGLFLFLVWVVPLLAGSILGIAGAEGAPRDVLFGLSPVSALAMLCMESQFATRVPDALRLAALVPAIGLPFLFNNLVTLQRRKVDAAVRGGKPGTPSPLDADLAEASA
jgi:hypothetical protein